MQQTKKLNKLYVMFRFRVQNIHKNTQTYFRRKKSINTSPVKLASNYHSLRPNPPLGGFPGAEKLQRKYWRPTHWQRPEVQAVILLNSPQLSRAPWEKCDLNRQKIMVLPSNIRDFSFWV